MSNHVTKLNDNNVLAIYSALGVDPSGDNQFDIVTLQKRTRNELRDEQVLFPPLRAHGYSNVGAFVGALFALAASLPAVTVKTKKPAIHVKDVTDDKGVVLHAAGSPVLDDKGKPTFVTVDNQISAQDHLARHFFLDTAIDADSDFRAGKQDFHSYWTRFVLPQRAKPQNEKNIDAALTVIASQLWIAGQLVDASIDASTDKHAPTLLANWTSDDRFTAIGEEPFREFADVVQFKEAKTAQWHRLQSDKKELAAKKAEREAKAAAKEAAKAAPKAAEPAH